MSLNEQYILVLFTPFNPSAFPKLKGFFFRYLLSHFYGSFFSHKNSFFRFNKIKSLIVCMYNNVRKNIIFCSFSLAQCKGISKTMGRDNKTKNNKNKMSYYIRKYYHVIIKVPVIFTSLSRYNAHRSTIKEYS